MGHTETIKFGHGESLPKIYLFDNTGYGDFRSCYSMAEDGTCLGSHICSRPSFMFFDLHERPDRSARCREHYPNGYELVVLYDAKDLPPEVFERNQELAKAEQKEER